MCLRLALRSVLPDSIRSATDLCAQKSKHLLQTSLLMSSGARSAVVHLRQGAHPTVLAGKQQELPMWVLQSCCLSQGAHVMVAAKKAVVAAPCRSRCCAVMKVKGCIW